MYYDTKESGKRIKELRKQRGMTQEKLAEELNMTPKSVSKIETGERGTTIDTICLIAALLGTSVDFLVMGICPIAHRRIKELLEKIPVEKQELALNILEGILEKI